MNAQHALVRSILVALSIGLLASAIAYAQIRELGPAGPASDEATSNSGSLTSIVDDPDPVLGIRYGTVPRQPRYVLWGSPASPADPGNPDTRLRPLPTILLIDPATGAVVGVGADGTGQIAIRPGMIYLGADGYLRMALPARPLRHR